MKKLLMFAMMTGVVAACGGGAKNTAEPSEMGVESDTAAPSPVTTAKIDDLQFFTKSDPAADVTAYKSYAWVAMTGAVRDPEQRWSLPDFNIAKEIAFLIDRELRGKGMTEVAENPDVVIGYSAVVDMEAQKLLQDKDNNMDIIATVPQNALFVVFADPHSGEAVWVGAASGEMQENATDESMKARLDYTVTKIIGSIGR